MPFFDFGGYEYDLQLFCYGIIVALIYDRFSAVLVILANKLISRFGKSFKEHFHPKN